MIATSNSVSLNAPANRLATGTGRLGVGDAAPAWVCEVPRRAVAWWKLVWEASTVERPAIASELTTLCMAAVSDVTRLTRLRGAEFKMCVLSGIIISAMPAPRSIKGTMNAVSSVFPLILVSR